MGVSGLISVLRLDRVLSDVYRREAHTFDTPSLFIGIEVPLHVPLTGDRYQQR